MLVSVIQQSESAICVHLSPLSWTCPPSPPPLPLWDITELGAEPPELHNSFSLAHISHMAVHMWQSYSPISFIAQLLDEKAEAYRDQVTWSGHSYKVDNDYTWIFAFSWTFQITEESFLSNSSREMTTIPTLRFSNLTDRRGYSLRRKSLQMNSFSHVTV